MWIVVLYKIVIFIFTIIVLIWVYLHPPVNHGVRNLISHSCRKLKIPVFISRIQPENWTNIEGLCTTIIGSTDEKRDYKQAKSTIHNIFETIKSKTNDICLQHYCTKIIDYYNIPQVKQHFTAVYKEKLEDFKAENEMKRIVIIKYVKFLVSSLLKANMS
ncbi:unnamed protein product [Cunninghamella blakesleeana]